MNSYVALATTDSLARLVVDESGVPLQPGRVRGMLSASGDLDTVLLTVTVTTPTLDLATKLSDAVATRVRRPRQRRRRRLRGLELRPARGGVRTERAPGAHAPDAQRRAPRVHGRPARPGLGGAAPPARPHGALAGRPRCHGPRTGPGLHPARSARAAQRAVRRGQGPDGDGRVVPPPPNERPVPRCRSPHPRAGRVVVGARRGEVVRLTEPGALDRGRRPAGAAGRGGPPAAHASPRTSGWSASLGSATCSRAGPRSTRPCDRGARAGSRSCRAATCPRTRRSSSAAPRRAGSSTSSASGSTSSSSTRRRCCPVTDGAVLATLADGVILVVREGKTSRHQLGLSVQRLERVGCPSAGIRDEHGGRGGERLQHVRPSLGARPAGGAVRPHRRPPGHRGGALARALDRAPGGGSAEESRPAGDSGAGGGSDDLAVGRGGPSAMVEKPAGHAPRSAGPTSSGSCSRAGVSGQGS